LVGVDIVENFDALDKSRPSEDLQKPPHLGNVKEVSPKEGDVLVLDRILRKVEQGYVLNGWVKIARDSAANARGIDIRDPSHLLLESGVEDCGMKERTVDFRVFELVPHCVEHLQCITLTAERFVALVELAVVVLGQELGNKLDVDHGDLNFLRMSTMFRFVPNLDRILESDLPRGTFTPP